MDPHVAYQHINAESSSMNILEVSQNILKIESILQVSLRKISMGREQILWDVIKFGHYPEIPSVARGEIEGLNIMRCVN